MKHMYVLYQSQGEESVAIWKSKVANFFGNVQIVPCSRDGCYIKLVREK
jgi:hypothetical protein